MVLHQNILVQEVVKQEVQEEVMHAQEEKGGVLRAQILKCHLGIVVRFRFIGMVRDPQELEVGVQVDLEIATF